MNSFSTGSCVSDSTAGTKVSQSASSVARRVSESTAWATAICVSFSRRSAPDPRAMPRRPQAARLGLDSRIRATSNALAACSARPREHRLATSTPDQPRAPRRAAAAATYPGPVGHDEHAAARDLAAPRSGSTVRSYRRHRRAHPSDALFPRTRFELIERIEIDATSMARHRRLPRRTSWRSYALVGGAQSRAGDRRFAITLWRTRRVIASAARSCPGPRRRSPRLSARPIPPQRSRPSTTGLASGRPFCQYVPPPK